MQFFDYVSGGMVARIFVSYSRADRQFADEFVPLLRKVYGLEHVWFDEDIPGGHAWWQLILDQIAQCELFVYLLSNEALASPYCQAEFQEALRLQKPVLPVIVRPKTQIADTLPDDIRQVLQQTQWVDLSQGFKDPQASAALYAAINRLLEQAPPSSAISLTSEPMSEPHVPDKPARRRLTEPWAIIIAAIVTGVFAIAAATVALGGRESGNGSITTAELPRRSVSVPSFSPVALPNFEYGGHVFNPDSDETVLAMREAGMRWMVRHIRHSRGMQPSMANEIINSAHEQDFKILLRVRGDKDEMDDNPSEYVREFSNFLGGVASLRPDAIEVWPEANLDRGLISGEFYADLLREAYLDIKGANSNIILISGAPAPIGLRGVFDSTTVVNDDIWIQEMIDAGGLNYPDCVGASFTSSNFSPLAHDISEERSLTLFRDLYWEIIGTYWELVRGEKPICFLAVGYLSAEGHGNLPPGFGWAENITAQEQAEWLEDILSLSSQDNRVRLVMIWNIDFPFFTEVDPMGGYAIIRPDGSCPLCNMLASD